MLPWALWVLVFCFCFYSGANAQSTTPDLLEPSAENWTGDYGTGWWGGTSGGPNPNRLPNDTGFIWSYGQTALGTSIAINNALQEQGIQVDGFTYKWRVKNGNANIFANQPGIDPMEITVDVHKADGTLYQSYSYDYGFSHNWTTHEGTQLFPDSFLPPSFFGNIDITAEATDSGFWAGWYGPEFNVQDSEFSLIYSTNPCYDNSLYDPACPGYATALALQIFNQQCTADPLYDTTCPGYQTAYFTQQCTIDPLYDPACPGYASAYLTQQCTLDIMYSEECPGYEDYILSLVEDEDHHHPGDEIASIENLLTNDPVSQITEVPLIEDPIVNQVIVENNNAPIEEIIQKEVIQDDQTNREVQSDSNDKERVDSEGDSGQDGSNNEEEIVRTEEGTTGGSEPEQSAGKDDKSGGELQEKVLEKIVDERVATLAEKMSDAASFEAQKLVQSQILVLLNFKPGFNGYRTEYTSGFYPDGQMYDEKVIPESRRGLRNGLAQQILHEKMVDMQYE